MTTLPAEDGAQRSAEVERLRRLFRFFAATQCRGNSLVYETLSEGVASDDSLLDLLMRTPTDQRRPSLLFAAVNHLRGAIGFALAAGPAPVVDGDAVTDTARVLAELPGHEPIAVFAATLLSYLGADARAAFLGQLDEVAAADPSPGSSGRHPALSPPRTLAYPPCRGRWVGATPCLPSEPACAAQMVTRTACSHWPIPTCAGSPRPATRPTTSTGYRPTDFVASRGCYRP